MTDTRKQIIELIEPYLDKTLSEHCSVYWDNRYGICLGEKVDTSEYGNGEMLMNFSFEKGRGLVCSDIPKSMIILGHYGITAVLKYIDNLSFYFYPGAGFLDNLYFSLGEKEIEHKWQIDGKFFMIPNKPLHLYTEQEDKDLLELLKKLGPTQEK